MLKYFRLNKFSFAFLSVLLLALGCSKESRPPEPLSIEQLPAAMEKAFSTAKGEVKDLATQIIASVQAQDFGKALLDLQTLSAKAGLNKEQGSVTVRATLTMNDALQAAAAKGDEKAAVSAAALKQYKMTK